MKWVLRLLGGLLGLVVLAVLALVVIGHRPHAGDTRVDVDIAQPPEVVWTWITDPPHLKQWVTWLVEVRNETPGVDGVGARETWIMDDPNLKKRIEIPSTVLTYDKPRSLSVNISMAGAFDGVATYTLTPTATGTHLVQAGTWRYLDPFSRLMEPLVTPQANKKGVEDFKRLKALAERS